MQSVPVRCEFFFFLKQKAAYEIDCDWSSDVLFRSAAVDELVHFAVRGAGDVAQHGVPGWLLFQPVDRHHRGQLLDGPTEIGKGSGGERVEISVVGVLFKKKNTQLRDGRVHAERRAA